MKFLRGLAAAALLLLGSLDAHAVIKNQSPATGGGGGSGTVTSVGATSSDSSVTITGSPITTSGSFGLTVSATNIASGTLPCARLPALTGPITTSGCAATVGANQIALTNLAQIEIGRAHV